jgi:hypothetical protein
MAYKLGAVKPWVSAAAEEVGQRFKLKDIGGYRAKGSVKTSDHPKGLALDLMTSDKNKGDAISSYLQANAKRLGITYVIWDRRSWNAGDPPTKWKAYNGPSPHTDHVHVSFDDKAPTGGGDPIGSPVGWIPGSDLVGAVGTAAGALKDMVGGVSAVGDLAKKAMWLALPTTQVRIVTGILGIGFLLIGVRFLVKEVRE